MNRETTDPDILENSGHASLQTAPAQTTYAKCRHYTGPNAPVKPCPYCTVTNLELNWQAQAGEPATTPVANLVDLTNGGRFPLLGFRFRIGRQSDNHIEVKDSAVSRTHAIITFENDDYFIDDLGSTNGTLLNGRVLARRERLEEGDVVKVGRTKFQFSVTDSAESTIPLKS